MRLAVICETITLLAFVADESNGMIHKGILCVELR